jgi:hypothetical protein
MVLPRSEVRPIATFEAVYWVRHLSVYDGASTSSLQLCSSWHGVIRLSAVRGGNGTLVRRTTKPCRRFGKHTP